MDNDSIALDYAKVDFSSNVLFQGDANSLNNLKSCYCVIVLVIITYKHIQSILIISLPDNI